MIDKNIDYALIGHNYLTFLLSVGLINRGKKVLLLDDERFNYGDFFTNSLTQIDLEFIKKFGEKSTSTALNNIDDYLLKEERTFFIGKKQILLGNSPGENLMELCRKFPEFFILDNDFTFSANDLENFDREYFEICQSIATKLVSPDRKLKLFQIFSESLSQSLSLNFKKIFENFINIIDDKTNESEVFKSQLITLVYLTRGFYQSHFSTTGTKIELMHNLLCLISPYYRLDHQRLNSDLLHRFQETGGEFKKLNLADLKFQRGKILGIELESYDGLINPKKIIFVGGHPLGLPIKFERPKNIYNCLYAEVETTTIPADLIDKKIVFSSAMKVSTGRPMFEARFFKNKIELNIVVLKKNGIKVEFIKQQILEEIQSDLKFLFSHLDFTIESAEMKFTHDIFIEEFTKNNKLKNEFKLKNKLSELMFFIDPLVFNRPRNVYYLGPYNDGFLGTLSSLIEIHRWQEHI